MLLLADSHLVDIKSLEFWGMVQAKLIDSINEGRSSHGNGQIIQ